MNRTIQLTKKEETLAREICKEAYRTALWDESNLKAMGQIKKAQKAAKKAEAIVNLCHVLTREDC